MVRWLAGSLVSHDLIHFRVDIWSPFAGFTAGGPVLMGSTYRGPIFMGSAYRGPILMGSTYCGPIFLGFAYRGPIFMGSTSILWIQFQGFYIHLVALVALPSWIPHLTVLSSWVLHLTDLSLWVPHLVAQCCMGFTSLVTLRYDFILWDHDLVIYFYDILTSHSLYIIHLYI